jgi:hypothetical protein
VRQAILVTLQSTAQGHRQSEPWAGHRSQPKGILPASAGTASPLEAGSEAVNPSSVLSGRVVFLSRRRFGAQALLLASTRAAGEPVVKSTGEGATDSVPTTDGAEPLVARVADKEGRVGRMARWGTFLTLALVGCSGLNSERPMPTVVPTPTAASTATAPPALRVFKLADPSMLGAGETVRFRVIVMNNVLADNDPGADIMVADVLPPTLELLRESLSSGAVYEGSTRTVSWRSSVPRGGSVELSYAAHVTVDAAGAGQVTNTAVVTDAFGQQLSASASVSVHPATATPMPATPIASPTVAARPSETLALPTATKTSKVTPTVDIDLTDTVPYIKALVVTSEDPPVYFLVAGDVLYSSVDRGMNWSLASMTGLPAGVRMQSVAVDYRHPGTMYACTERGLYRREKAPGAWTFVHDVRATALAVDLQDSDVLWAGIRWDTAQQAIIVKSTDRGRTWGKADYGIQYGGYTGYVSAILIHPRHPNILWAHVRPGWRRDWPAGFICRGGRDGSWEQLSLGSTYDFAASSNPWENQNICTVSGIAFDPNSNYLFAGCDLSWYNGKNPAYRLLRSGNADALNSSEVSWELAAILGRTVEGNLSVNTVRPLAVDARSPKSLFVVVDVTVTGGPQKFRLMVSHDDGATFEWLPAKGLPSASE